MTDDRTAKFTSSSIYRLCGNGTAKGTIGAPFFTYVQEKINEGLAGRSLANQASATATDWGHTSEVVAHSLLGLEYTHLDDADKSSRFYHPTLPWCGIPDGFIGDQVVTDIKSPFTLTSFFEVIGEGIKKEWHWQIVSNSILTGRPECELIVFMPKLSMLEDIRDQSRLMENWIHTKADNELPWTADDSPIEAITKIRFTPTQEDIDLLTLRVQAASRCLVDVEYYNELKQTKRL
jgi:hypothetical protein